MSSWIVAGGIALAFVLLQAADIATFPLITTDEAFLNDPALQLVRHGAFHNDLLSANPGFSGPYFWQPPGLALMQSLFYALFGFGIWQTRLSAIVFGGFACAVLFRLVEILTGRRGVAFGAAALLTCWPTFLLTAKIARMDTHAIFFMLVATLLAVRELTAEVPSRTLSLAAGLCIGVAGLFHSACITWAAGLVVGYAIQARRTPLNVLTMIVGAATPPLGWAIMALLNPEAFAGQFLYQLLNRSAQGGLMRRLSGDALRYVHELDRLPFVYVLIGFVTILAMGKMPRSRPFWMALVMTAVAFLLNALLAGKSYGYYQLYPLTCLILVGAVVWAEASVLATSRGIRALSVAIYGTAILNMALVAYAPRIVALSAQSAERDHRTQFAALRSLIKPGDQVWGSAVAWPTAIIAGARMDSRPEESVPIQWTSDPDPTRHRFVVVLEGQPFDHEGYRKVGTFGRPLPRVFNSTFASSEYVYDIWQSTRLP